MAHILAVDDSRTIREMVSAELTRQGHQVTLAEDGLEALELAREHAFDAVVTDVNMPRMDGVTLTAQLRALPEYRFKPILLLTTERAPETRAAAKEAGATGWLPKPFDPETIERVLRRVLPRVMAVDPLFAVFVEEAAELTEVLESGLLTPDAGADHERVAEMFRAAHSMKGAAAVVGLPRIGRLMHEMEHVLAEVRDGKRALDGETTAALLAGVDATRAVLGAARAGSEVPPGIEDAAVAALQGRGAAPPAFARDRPVAPALGATEVETSTFGEASRPAGAAPPSLRELVLTIRPDAEVFRRGHDPALLIRCLADFGTLLDVGFEGDELPSWESFDHELCYVTFRVRLATAATDDELREPFDWADLEVDIAEVEEVAPAPASPPRLERETVRVETSKIDALIDLVGELVITHSVLARVGAELSDAGAELRTGLSALGRNTRDLQETVLRVRMLPVQGVFARIPRVVHDLSAELGKQVAVQIVGQDTEIDKAILERVADPLVHLVRNALDHGLESPEERRASGKPAVGRLTVRAYHDRASVVIEVEDDGRGLDRDAVVARARSRGLIADDEEPSDDAVVDLLFRPGFSTREEVTEVSGRGVGMDVVRRNVRSLGGSVELRTKPREGTTVVVRLPLTMAILDAQLVRVGGQTYVVPVYSLVQTVPLAAFRVHQWGGGRMVRFRDQPLPLVRLDRFFGLRRTVPQHGDRALLMVVEADGLRTGLIVDELLTQQQVVVKPLEDHYKRIDVFTGATILGDGGVALILDVAGVHSRWQRSLGGGDLGRSGPPRGGPADGDRSLATSAALGAQTGME